MKKVYVHSLGCSKNLVDSENMIGILTNKGYKISEYADKADYIVINTCSFINDAKEESIEAVLNAVQLKGKSKKPVTIIVTGCLSQRYASELSEEIPEADILIGTNGFERISEIIEEYEKNETKIIDTQITADIKEDLPRCQLTPKHYAYLKIAEGCSNHCTYCIIPQIRGPYRSRDMEHVISEAEKLAADGVKEIILIAQDTSKYGLDLYKERKLHELIHRISLIEGIRWIRLHYLYPEDIYDELITEFRDNKKVLKYFDIPMQHINDDVLKKMNRHTNREQITSLISKIRKEMPDATIRTSLITGFPGETEEAHMELMKFLQQNKLDRVGIFKYSREENTPAYRLPDQIEDDIKDRRYNELMELQLGISYENNLQKIGRTYDVLIEEKDVDNIYVGRTYMDSCDVDGCVYVTSDYELEIGGIYPVKINDAMEYDLIGDFEPTAN